MDGKAAGFGAEVKVKFALFSEYLFGKTCTAEFMEVLYFQTKLITFQELLSALVFLLDGL